MEFLRFGSSIPGSYWGCCAVDIIQNFKVHPEESASIALVNGDYAAPLFKNSKQAFIGLTHKDIFLQRLRIGTFDTRDMPNHGFLAILSDKQIQGSVGQAWLKVLKEQGFEFIRTVSNSVYSGTTLGESGDQAMNHIFALFRNIGQGNVFDPYTPPKAWTDLPEVVPEAWTWIESQERFEFATLQREGQLERWKALPPLTLYTEEEVEAAGVAVTYAGRRSEYMQERKDVREARDKAKGTNEKKAKANPFGCAAEVTATAA